jgi:hypothetical protein
MKTCFPEPFARRDSPPRGPARTPANGGFALIVNLTLMILLTVIAVGLLTLSSISLRTSTQGQAMSEAKSNARMALILALAELQKAAGPDQRITAAADVLSGSSKPGDYHAHWTGVWKSDTIAVPPATVANYNPATPDQRKFVTWLVSSKNPGNTSSLNNAAAAAGTDDLLIYQDKDAAESAKVPKVRGTGTYGEPGSYAYWVEDEDIKADLAWNEGEFTNDEHPRFPRPPVRTNGGFRSHSPKANS